MKEERLISWQKILIALILAGMIYTLFGIRELSRWNREMVTDRPRILFDIILTPIHAFSEAVEIDFQAEYYKERFHDLKNISFRELFPEAAEFIVKELSEYLTVDYLLSLVIQEEPVTEQRNDDFILDSGISDGSQKKSARVTAFPAYSSQNAETTGTSGSVPRGESILLIGDSLANSCSTAFIPMVNRLNDLELTKYGKVSANLSNPVFEEWFGELDQILNSREFDIIIMMMGANAAQTIIEGENRWEYGSERWENIYRDRAEKLISKMRSNSRKVYWVGIPPMMQKNYRENMEIHNRRISKICKDTGIDYLPIETIVGDEKGKYLEYKIINGRQVRIRHTDGVHYSRAGSDLLSRYILSSIFPDISLSEGS